MKQSASQIKQKLNIIWPNLFNMWIPDRNFWLPTKERLDEFVEIMKEKLKDRVWLDQISDCDDFARWLWGEASWIRATMAYNREIPQEEWLPWSVHFVMGTKVRGMSMYHSWNLCLCSDGKVYMIDPTDRCKVWEANNKYDDIYFVI